MRHPPTGAMELLLMIALCIAVVVTMFAIQEPPGDRTRFTLERSDATQIVRDRRAPPIAEETALGR